MKNHLIQDIDFFLLKKKETESIHPFTAYFSGLLSFLKKDKKEELIDFLKWYKLFLTIPNTPILKIDDAIWIIQKKINHTISLQLLEFLSNSLQSNSIDYEVWKSLIYYLSKNKNEKELKICIKLILFVFKKLKGKYINQSNLKFCIQLIFSIKKDAPFNYKSAISRNWYLLYTIINIINFKGFLGEYKNELLSIAKYISSSQIEFTKTNEKLMDRLFTLIPTVLLKKLINLSKINFLVEINSEFPQLFYENTPSVVELKNCSTLLQAFFPDKIIPSVFYHHLYNLNELQKDLFFHVLKGGSIRKHPLLKISMDKKAYHHLRNMCHTDGLEFWEYFFIARLASLGIEFDIAIEIYHSIPSEKNNLNFWAETMVLLHNKGLSISRINPVMDYINEKIFVEKRQICFKKKKINNLWHDVQNWHKEILQRKVPKFFFPPYQPENLIHDFVFESSSNKRYRIKQIKDSRELYEEGRTLNHCVYSYTNSCLIGHKYIFSLRELFDDNTEQALVTLEINRGYVKQARGNFNRLVNNLEFQIIESWAKENKLKLNFFHQVAT